MSEKIAAAATPQDALEALIATGTVDGRVAAGLKAYSTAAARVPAPAYLSTSPVRYSTGANA